MCNRIAAIYALESVLNALFWRYTGSSIIILVWCLKSILGYTIYCGIYGHFRNMYTIYCGVLVGVVQCSYLCSMYSFVGCFCVCCIVGLFVNKLLFLYLFLWCGDVVWYMFCDADDVRTEVSYLIDIVVSIFEYWLLM